MTSKRIDPMLAAAPRVLDGNSVSPAKPLDDGYRGFFELLGQGHPRNREVLWPGVTLRPAVNVQSTYAISPPCGAGLLTERGLRRTLSDDVRWTPDGHSILFVAPDANRNRRTCGYRTRAADQNSMA